MNENRLESIEKALAFIESRLTQKIKLNDIAHSAHISKFHFHRLLSRAVGQPIMNYIRARKLTASIDMLLKPHYNLLDISYYFAFEHEQSYIRAFKKQFGLTPNQFRKDTPVLLLIEKADLGPFKEIHDGLIFTPTIVFRPAMHIIGSQHQIYTKDNKENLTSSQVGNEFFYNQRFAIKNTVQDRVYIGLTKYVPWEGERYTYYFPSVQVSSFEDIPAGMASNTLPAGKYAVFTYVGTFHPRQLTIRHLEQIWSYIYSFFRYQRPNFHQSKPFHFEYIDEQLATDNYCEVDIYFPIRTYWLSL